MSSFSYQSQLQSFESLDPNIENKPVQERSWQVIFESAWQQNDHNNLRGFT